MKTCPYCAEEVKDEAIKCKHCGSMLNSGVNQQTRSSEVFVKRKTFNFKPIIYLVAVVLIVSAVFIFIAKDSSSPASVSQNFIMDIKNDNLLSAKKLLSSDAKATYSGSFLERMSDKHSEGVTYTAPENLTMTGNKAIQIIEYTSTEGETSKTALYLEKSFWGWKIVNITQ